MLAVPTIGDLLKFARETKGMSQDALAERTGVSQGAISRIEKGVTDDPGVLLLSRLAAALDQPLAALIPEAAVPTRPAIDRQQLGEVVSAEQQDLDALLHGTVELHKTVRASLELIASLAVALKMRQVEKSANELLQKHDPQ